MAKRKKQSKPKRPRGRPRVTNEIVDARILATLAVGASIEDAADEVGIGRETIYRKRREDPVFGTRVLEAIARGKKKLIERVTSSKDWRAAAWMLERRFGKDFGRKLQLEHGGAEDLPPIKQTVEVTDEREEFDFEKFERLYLTRTRRGGPPDGSGAAPQDRN